LITSYLPTESQHGQVIDSIRVAVDVLIQYVLYEGLLSGDKALTGHVVVVAATNQLLRPMRDDGSSQ